MKGVLESARVKEGREGRDGKGSEKRSIDWFGDLGKDWGIFEAGIEII